MPTLFTYLPN